MKKAVKYVDFDTICRLCLRKTEISPFLELTTRHNLTGQNITFVEMLESYLKFKISKKDHKPQNVCRSCITQLCQSYHFFEMCALSNKLLNEALKHENVPQEEITEHITDFNGDAEFENSLPIISKIESVVEDINRNEENVTEVADDYSQDASNDNFYIDYIATCREEVIVEYEHERALSSTNQILRNKKETYMTSEEHDYSKIINDLNRSTSVKKIIRSRKKIKPVTLPVEKPIKKRLKKPIKPKQVIPQKMSVFNCLVCKEVFAKFKDIISHFDKVHEGTSRCILCDKVFRRMPMGLKYHMNTHRRNEKRFDCKKCYEFFLTKDEMTRHFESAEHNADPNTCPICGKAFPYKSNMQRHMDIFHSSESKFQCPSCGKCFRYSAGLSKHVKGAHKGFKVLCYICGKDFRTNVALRRHIDVIHEGKKKTWPYREREKLKRAEAAKKTACEAVRIKCTLCEAEFSSVRGLHRHKLSLHGIVGHMYKCSRCTQSFLTPQETKDHLNSVHIKYQCELCRAGFGTEIAYKSHVEKHETPGYSKCLLCGLECLRATSLKVHMNIHTGEKPFKCDKCDKSFRQSAHLRYHQFMHSVKKPYECHLCDKRFAQKNYLQAHINVHKGVKPFACELCDKAYPDKGTLSKHVKKIHDGLGLTKKANVEVQPISDTVVAQNNIIKIDTEDESDCNNAV